MEKKQQKTISVPKEPASTIAVKEIVDSITDASEKDDPKTVVADAENYDISYEQGHLTVVEADAVVVRAKSYSRQYGDENPVFEFETEGAALDGTPEIVCSAVANSPVGSYTIEVKQGSIKNYNVHFESGSLVITKAPLSISWRSLVVRPYLRAMRSFSSSV